ncbi:hypothetical protein PMAYCL1PPCAC_20167, partial [Pristionchus mayeri]
EGVGIVHVSVVTSPLSVENVVKGVVYVLKNFKLDELKESKRRTKHHLLKLVERPARKSAVARSMEILTGMEQGSVLAALENVSESQVEEAAARFASNLSIAAYGNIENVPHREDIMDEN